MGFCTGRGGRRRERRREWRCGGGGRKFWEAFCLVEEEEEGLLEMGRERWVGLRNRDGLRWKIKFVKLLQGPIDTYFLLGVLVKVVI